MEIRKQKGKQVGRLTVTEQIDQKHQEDLQRLRGFRLLDDDFLTKCFEGDTASIELVLQIVLEKPDLKVLDVRTQVFVENLLNRSVRLDILATDSTGAKLNVEVQRSDKGAGRKKGKVQQQHDGRKPFEERRGLRQAAGNVGNLYYRE